ncbi:MAG TPA: protein kinase, partial [Polyangiaceae bacterium]|nr:protein kinase [Polyangiaceae bacterium]
SAQNILISREGHIKISDFGIAKALGSARDSTKTGHVRGKRSYISPEHALGLPTDRRSDVFSLGVVLYLATAGRFPFREDGCATEAPMARLLSARCLPPSRVCSGYPLELEWIVMRALARDPAARFPSADAMRSALEQYMLRSGAFVTDRDVARVLIERRGAEIAKREQRVRLLSAASEAATSCAGFSQTLDPVLPCSRTLSPPLSWRAAGRQALLVLAVSALGTAVGIGTKARTGSGAHSAALLGRAGLHMRVGSAASMAATGSQTAARAASDGDAAALGASASPAQASTEPSAIQIWLPGKSRSKTTEESSVGAALPARLGASPSTHDSRALRAHRTERVFSVQPSSGASPDNMNLGDVRPGVAAAPGMPPPAAAAAPRKVAPSQADPPRVPIGPLEQEL